MKGIWQPDQFRKTHHEHWKTSDHQVYYEICHNTRNKLLHLKKIPHSNDYFYLSEDDTRHSPLPLKLDGQQNDLEFSISRSMQNCNKRIPHVLP